MFEELEAMRRWTITAILMLSVPFLFLGLILAMCGVLNLHLDAIGKCFTLIGGLLCSAFVFIARHG